MFIGFIKKTQQQILMKELYQINALLLFFSSTSVTISSLICCSIYAVRVVKVTKIAQLLQNANSVTALQHHEWRTPSEWHSVTQTFPAGTAGTSASLWSFQLQALNEVSAACVCISVDFKNIRLSNPRYLCMCWSCLCYLLAKLGENSWGEIGGVAATRVLLLTPVLLLIVHRLNNTTDKCLNHWRFWQKQR